MVDKEYLPCRLFCYQMKKNDQVGMVPETSKIFVQSAYVDEEKSVKLYKEHVMDHYHNPRNRGRLENPDFATGQFNPSCGDSVGFDAHVQDGKIKKLTFIGDGCAVSQASASMLTEHCTGKSIDELLTLDKDFMLKLVGMPLGPMRIRCALLPLQALHKGINDYKSKQGDVPGSENKGGDI